MARSKNIKDEVEEKPLPSVFGTPVEGLDAPSPEEGEEVPNDEDIFDDYANRLVRDGDGVTFTIFRDGDCIAPKVAYPWSWDQTYKKWGGGTYKVLVRSKKLGKYVKGQSQTFARIDVDEVEEDDNQTDDRGSSTTDLLLLLEKMKASDREESRAREERAEQTRREEKERERHEAEQRSKESKESNNMTMQLMMQMMKAQSDQTTALLAGMMGGKKDDGNFEKIVAMMDARTEKMLDRLTNKSNKEIDALKLVELQEKSEQRGYDRAMDAHKLAEKKAVEISERGNPVDSEPKGPSTTEKLLEAVMPMAQMFMQSKGLVPGAAPASPAINPHKPALPAPSSGPLLGMPGGVMRPPMGVPGSVKTPVPVVVKKEDPMKAKKEFIENVVIGEIGKDLGANMLTPAKLNPEASADRSLEVLKPQGITPVSLCSDFTLDDMIRVARAKGIPDTIKPYLERFYARIKTQAGMANGAAASGGQPGNS